MNCSLVIDDRFMAKRHFECAPITQSVKLTTRRTGAPACLTFQMLKTGGLSFGEGDPVFFSADGQALFRGFVFTKEKDRWGNLSVTAYDQTRYLLANQVYRFEGVTPEDAIRRVAREFELPVGTLEETGYVVPYLDNRGGSCLDTIQSLLRMAAVNTGKVSVFFDDCGSLCLRRSEGWRVPAVLGAGSLVTDYSYTTDIDSDTYTAVRLTRSGRDPGEPCVQRDPEGIRRWGLLQYSQTVEEELSRAQMAEQAKVLLAERSRVLRTLELEALGVVGLRAGQMVFVDIPDLGDIGLREYVRIESAEHLFEHGEHKMRLGLTVRREGEGNGTD